MPACIPRLGLEASVRKPQEVLRVLGLLSHFVISSVAPETVALFPGLLCMSVCSHGGLYVGWATPRLGMAVGWLRVIAASLWAVQSQDRSLAEQLAVGCELCETWLS